MGKSVPPCDDRKSFSLPEQHRAIPEDPDRSSFYISMFFLDALYNFTWVIIFHILVLILLAWEFVYFGYALQPVFHMA